MAQVLIRGLDDSIKRRLQEQARRRGVSMEAEARDILTRQLRGPGSRLERLRAQVEETGGVDLVLPPRDDYQRLVEFE